LIPQSENFEEQILRNPELKEKEGGMVGGLGVNHILLDFGLCTPIPRLFIQQTFIENSAWITGIGDAKINQIQRNK